jgi:agmatinase
MRENKTLINSLEEMRIFLKNVSPDRPVYLTLDVDFFDPAYVSGTGTPEAGGETFHSYIAFIKLLKNMNLIGADIVELSPPLDQSGNSTVFVSKVLRETLLAMVK